jgi:hypothetical protein
VSFPNRIAEFGLLGSHKALNDRVVPALGLATRACAHAVLLAVYRESLRLRIGSPRLERNLLIASMSKLRSIVEILRVKSIKAEQMPLRMARVRLRSPLLTSRRCAKYLSTLPLTSISQAEH